MEKEIFEFIEMMVQDVGINVYGIRPYIQKQFGLSKKEAGEVLIKYMRQ
tara:strand:+ start:681 stop:827 length:147 start_codon:yes stop_codon:yes gene_type:complete